MKKLDNVQSYNFRYMISLLIVINFSLIISVIGDYPFKGLLPIIYLPFGLSYLSGYLYFLFKGTY